MLPLQKEQKKRLLNRFRPSLFRLFCLLILHILPSTPTILHAADFVLVANRDTPVNQLSKREVKNIFLTKTKIIHGVRVQPIMLKDEQLTREFLRSELGKTPAQFTSYYRKMIFTGRGKPPKKFGTASDLLAYVGRNNGAIGYVPSDAVTDSVKIIQVTE